MNGVGSAFQPRAVCSSQLMMSSGEAGVVPSSARWLRIRWTDSVMFSHEPLNGVYSGITPWANNHSTKAHVFVWITNWAGERLPADARLRDGLVGASFIHAPHRQAQLRACGVRLLDECFFCGGIRILDLDLNHHSATRATPLGYTGVAPA